MIQRIVLFKLKSEYCNDAARAELLAGCRILNRMFEIGTCESAAVRL